MSGALLLAGIALLLFAAGLHFLNPQETRLPFVCAVLSIACALGWGLLA